MADGRVIIETKLDTSGLSQGAKTAKSTVENLGKSIENAGRQSETLDKGLQGATASLKTLETIAKSSIVIKLTQTAMKLISGIAEETSVVVEKMKAASTLFGDVAVNQEQLLNNLYRISNETGESMEVLGQSVYDALSASVEPTEDMANVLKVVSNSAKLAKGGFTDTSTALSATLTVVNAYKMSLDELDSVQSMLLQTQNKGVTTVGELGDALASVTPTAASFGVKFSDIATSIALMTKQGTNTRVATTALAQVISELGKSGTTASKNLEEAAESAGLTETSFKGLLEKGYSLGQILEVMNQYAQKNNKSMVDMFSSVEAGRATLQLVGDNAEDFNDILESMNTSAGLVSQSFEKTVDPMAQLGEAWSNLQSKIGMKFKPTAESLAGILTTVIEKVSGQDTATYSLAETTEWLKGQIDETKKSQDEYAKAIDAVTGSMTLQQKIQYIAYVRSVADNFDTLAESIRNAEAEQKTYTMRVENFDKRRAEIEEKYGISWDEIIEKMALANGSVLKMNSIFKGWTTEDKSLVNNYINNYDAYKAKVDEATESITANRNTISDYMSIVVDAIKAGVVSLGTLRAYNEDFANEVEKALNSIESKTKKVTDTATEGAQETAVELSELAKEYNKVAEEADAMFDTLSSTDDIDGTISKLVSVRDKLKDIIERAKECGDIAVFEAANKSLDELNKNIKTLQWNEFVESFQTQLKSAGESLAQGLGSAVEDLIYQLMTIPEQVKEIDKQIDAVATKEGDNIKALTEAEAELQDAKARGNAKDIEAAEQKIAKLKETQKGLSEERKTLEKNKESVKSGADAWKSMSKVALSALADVLESLGAQLAAQAVVQAISWNWGMAAIAAAGSVAAYIAAGAIRASAAKYEQGGIVGGNSRHGDQILARVNSGELILNAAQQENLARIIEAAAVLAQTSGGGSGITVNFEGVNFYGLDEPAVGKAIYDNIQTLKYEGVL